MKCLFIRLLPLLMAAALLFSAAGCSQLKTGIDAAAVLESLLQQISFSTELSEVGEAAALYFPDLPEGADIQLYTGNGYYADEVALLTLSNPSDCGSALDTVKKHLAELRSQFMNYLPEEVCKIDNAVTYQTGQYVFLCVTDDYKNANLILTNSHDASYQIPQSNAQTVPDPTETSTAAASELPKEPYPVLKSRSGTYYDYGTGVIRVDNAAFEKYGYDEAAAKEYAAIVNSTADKLAGKTAVYCMAIPTATGIVLPDDIAAILPGYKDQGQATENIFAKMDSNVVTVNCYDNLMRHRDEYLYFRTDHHWNGLGAYYAYKVFCQAKGIPAYTLEQRTEKRFDNFLGSLYWQNCSKDPILSETPDTVVAYCPVSDGASMQYTDRNGDTYDWNIITDVSDWASSSKYCTFAGGDNPLSVLTNPDVTDGSVCIIVKESYGNALLPYLVDHYSTVYEIDYRYWEGDLIDFALEKGADDLIFANNLTMISSSYLVGMLATIAS